MLQGHTGGGASSGAGGADGSPEPTTEKVTGTTRKCANCGQIGHIKTNKKCVRCSNFDGFRALAAMKMA